MTFAKVVSKGWQFGKKQRSDGRQEHELSHVIGLRRIDFLQFKAALLIVADPPAALPCIFWYWCKTRLFSSTGKQRLRKMRRRRTWKQETFLKLWPGPDRPVVALSFLRICSCNHKQLRFVHWRQIFCLCSAFALCSYSGWAEVERRVSVGTTVRSRMI